MKKKTRTKWSLWGAGILLLLFVLFLAGLMLWENNGPEAVPTEPSASAPQIEQTWTHEQTMPTTLPTETTMPEFEARTINFLLVGRDWHSEGENGRSDSMILCSVDTGAKTVTLISFLRDIYLEIPGYGSNRLNASYSWGGAELLKETLKENFDVDVDVTLEIDFDGFEGLIDTLGGVQIELTDREAGYLNKNYGWTLSEGDTLLNGEQALAYSRIRYLDSDFVRTERQQNVLASLLEKYRSASFQTILNVTDAFLDESTSDHTDEELLGYAMELYSTLSSAELTTCRIPADGSYSYETIRGMSVIEVDFEECKALLQELLSDKTVPET